MNKMRAWCSRVSSVDRFERRLGAYLAASAGVPLLAAEAEAVIVSNSSVQPFGINQEVNIDFNGDGQIDFQIDHDRVDLGGGNFVDYLQIDKNDSTGASPGEDPLAFPGIFDTFPPNGNPNNDPWEAGYVVPAGIGDYPAALLQGAEIGPLSTFDFQEGDNFLGGGMTIRANRLIDEDAGQVDIQLGGLDPADYYVPTNGPNFVGLNGEVRYLGLKMDLQSTGSINYGWIGIRITNEADATGEVVGWGYETQAGVSILAGALAPGLDGDFNGDGKVDAADYVHWRKNDGTPAKYNEWRTNFGAPGGSGSGFAGSGLAAVPEPSSILLSLFAGLAVVGAFLWRRIRRV